MMTDTKDNIREKDLNEYCEYDDVKIRRKVRADYRSLANVIEGDAKNNENQNPENYCNYLQQAEDLFSKVKHPREAVHDSALLVALTKKGREQAQQLKTDIVSFDNHTFAEKLVTYLNGCHLTKSNEDQIAPSAWKKLGKKCCPLFKKAHTFDFLLGPLVLEVVVRDGKQSRKRQDKVLEGTTVKLKQIDTVEEQEEATTKEVERIFKTLRKATNKGKKPVCFFHFIINPESFGQSIENLFHLSFLVKDGRASIELNEDDLPFLNLHETYNEANQEEMIIRKQVLMSLTMQDWKDLIETFNITEATIPTRNTMFAK